MKIKHDVLREAIGIVRRAIQPSSGVPMYRSYQFEGGFVRGWDDRVGVRVPLETGITAAIEHAPFGPILDTLDSGDITLVHKDGVVRMSRGKSSWRFDAADIFEDGAGIDGSSPPKGAPRIAIDKTTLDYFGAMTPILPPPDSIQSGAPGPRIYDGRRFCMSSQNRAVRAVFPKGTTSGFPKEATLVPEWLIHLIVDLGREGEIWRVPQKGDAPAKWAGRFQEIDVVARDYENLLLPKAAEAAGDAQGARALDSIIDDIVSTRSDPVAVPEGLIDAVDRAVLASSPVWGERVNLKGDGKSLRIWRDNRMLDESVAFTCEVSPSSYDAKHLKWLLGSGSMISSSGLEQGGDRGVLPGLLVDGPGDGGVTILGGVAIKES